VQTDPDVRRALVELVPFIPKTTPDAGDAAALAPVVPLVVELAEALEAVPALRGREVRGALREAVHGGQRRVDEHDGGGEAARGGGVVGPVHGYLVERRAHQRQEEAPARGVARVPPRVRRRVRVHAVHHGGVVDDVGGERQEHEVAAGVPRRAQVRVERGVAVTAAAEAAQLGEGVGEAGRARARVRHVTAAQREAVRGVRGGPDGG